LKSAISRQREFLADTSAVQFTRNPFGLANALKKIGGLADGSKVYNPHAAEISHMYFGNGVKESLFGLLNTHPPLVERVTRLEPDFRGNFPKDVSRVQIDREEALVYTAAAQMRPSQDLSPVLRLQATENVQVPEDGLRRAMDSSDPVETGFGRELIESIPEEVLQSARNAFGARAVVYGLLLDAKKTV
jgi:hypothetical protein